MTSTFALRNNGHDDRSTSADDLIVAVTQVPDRYRVVLARFGALEDIDAALRARTGPGGWSALERITHVADWLHVSARCARRMLDGDDDRCVMVHVEAPRAGSNGWPSAAVLGALQSAAAHLGSVAREADGSAWDREHAVRTQRISLRNVVERALREAGQHLAEIERHLGTMLTPANRS